MQFIHFLVLMATATDICLSLPTCTFATSTPSPALGCLRSLPRSMQKTYDYVIVGGGPAGFVLAEQLSQDPKVHVVLLEASSDASNVEDVYIPGFAGNNEFSSRIWDYYVTSQKELNGATPHLAQGKLFGGGTGVNYRNYNRGARSVFDEWAKKSGNDELRWESLFNDFKATVKYEQNTTPSRFTQTLDPKAYGTGPVSVSRAQELDGFDPHWNDALRSTLDLPQVDFNSGIGIGVSYGVETISPLNRSREYALPAYGSLMANRRNARLLHGAYVSKINFAGKRAQSVTYVDTENGNATHTAHAKEIIISAGAIGSAKLLMLSGVGPVEHLKSVGVSVVLDSPDVGSNLQDHNYASIEVEVTDDVYTLSRWQNQSYLDQIKKQWHEEHSGPLANAPASSFSLVRVPYEVLPKGPAGQFHRSLPEDRGQLQMQYANVALLANTAKPTTPVMTLWVALTQPEASGTVRLKSSNFRDFPLIDTAYFGSEGDRACVLWGYKKLREVLQSEKLKGVTVREIYPGSNATTDAELMTAIRNGAQSYHHPMGTVALGKVLDVDFRVRGLQGIRVVDSSVFPNPPNCHPQADVYAIAHVAARQIKAADGRPYQNYDSSG